MLSSLIAPLFCVAMVLVPVVVYLFAQASYERASKDERTASAQQMTTIALVNQSTVCSDGHLAALVRALETQVNRDVAPLWKIAPIQILFVPRGHQPPSGIWELVVVDDADVAGALGYHTDDGQPRGLVFARTCLEAGAALSVTISHELVELLADPDTQRTITYGATTYSQELCDAVEADAYGYMIGQVLVSDFVTPAWFGRAKAGAIYDICHRLKKPRSLLPGGYVLEYTKRRGWHQLFAATHGNVVNQPGEFQSRPGTSGRGHRRLELIGAAAGAAV